MEEPYQRLTLVPGYLCPLLIEVIRNRAKGKLWDVIQ